MPFAATWTEEIITLSLSQKEKVKYHMVSLTCGIKNMTQMGLIRDIENRLLVAKGEGERGMAWECGISRYKLVYIEQLNNKVLCTAQGTIFNIL